MKKVISILLIFVIIMLYALPSFAGNDTKVKAESNGFYASANIDLGVSVGSAYLCDGTTGKVLYAENEFKAASPASVTKIMTLLLVSEAIEEGRISLNDYVIVSARAASMGGSQVFLEEGEKISVQDLVKSAVIASGNDAAVALAELCCGSEASFVSEMNKRAIELGLKNTNFENATGLDDTTVNHYTCAADIAKMSRELIKYDYILEYASIWQDTIRDGEFTLTNTNRLVRYYDGCNGLKTGSTDKAGYCVSATAKRGNLQLVAVVMGAKSRDERNEAARALLDFGFANYALFEKEGDFVESIPVKQGIVDFVNTYSTPISVIIDKSDLNKIEIIYEIPENLCAPVKEGQIVGKMIYQIDGEQIGESQIYANESVDKISFSKILGRILKRMIFGEFS